MSVEDWAKAWWEKPRWLVGGPRFDPEAAGLRDTVVEVGEPRKVDVRSFASLSRNCPYDGMSFNCWPKEG